MKELAGFFRIHIEPKEKIRVTFTVKADRTAFLDREMRWKVEHGDIDVEIGSSSEDIRLKGMFGSQKTDGLMERIGHFALGLRRKRKDRRRNRRRPAGLVLAAGRSRYGQKVNCEKDCGGIYRVAEKRRSSSALCGGEKWSPFSAGTQIGTLYSGNGSGGANVAGCGTILEECEKCGLTAEPLLKGFYQYKAETEPVTEQDEFDWTKVSEMVNSGIMYEIFGKYRPPLEEYKVPGALIYQAAEKTDTAVLVIGRNSGGEECDDISRQTIT